MIKDMVSANVFFTFVLITAVTEDGRFDVSSEGLVLRTVIGPECSF